MKEKKATDSEKYQSVIQALISARKDRKVWQTDIAAKLSKPQSFVSKYENYERRLDMVEFVDVCRAIGVSSRDATFNLGDPIVSSFIGWHAGNFH